MAKRVLNKSRNRVVAGVCAGIAEYLGWQPWLVRAVFVFVSLVWGTGLIAYAIFWLAMPPADANDCDLEDFRK